MAMRVSRYQMVQGNDAEIVTAGRFKLSATVGRENSLVCFNSVYAGVDVADFSFPD
ncbi:hypothetical protein [Thiomicrorhabdus sp. 6S3-12]|uniref:hypothetical protein n=1 Tax=Thiomicrorhabdus sp. 6S3-12 TaxID=2819681 RepID=UPI001AAC535A|nr:hypothetical protein [Thiomicrorhabdus sp. 6S3-12]MBO1924161.1 hypothetical protein [Thiomicrorhabdus sp. 6S3-12]